MPPQSSDSEFWHWTSPVLSSSVPSPSVRSKNVHEVGDDTLKSFKGAGRVSAQLMVPVKGLVTFTTSLSSVTPCPISFWKSLMHPVSRLLKDCVNEVCCRGLFSVEAQLPVGPSAIFGSTTSALTVFPTDREHSATMRKPRKQRERFTIA